MINSTRYVRDDWGGRLCNHLIRNVVMSNIAEKNNIQFRYSVFNPKLKELGLLFFESGTKTYAENIHVHDGNAIALLTGPPVYKNLVMNPSTYFQTPALSLYLRNYLWSTHVRSSIESHNRYAARYNNNNNVFIHIRLGDLLHGMGDRQCVQPISYYENALSKISFSGGYISSDSPDHELCKALSEKYGLTIFNDDEVNTIMMASTCKHLILSHGTYSWVIGVLGYYSDVYTPSHKSLWHGDIFNIPGWHAVDA
jgi:hypothetical protein